MDCDHYTIPGYMECIEQASNALRHELETLHRVQLNPHSKEMREGLRAMVAWRLRLLDALKGGG